MVFQVGLTEVSVSELYGDDVGTLGDTIVLQSDGSSTPYIVVTFMFNANCNTM